MRKVDRVIPPGAVVVYPHNLVHQMFGYANEGGTRKEMSRRGVVGVSGWPVDEVHEIFGADENGRTPDGVILGEPSTYKEEKES